MEWLNSVVIGVVKHGLVVKHRVKHGYVDGLVRIGYRVFIKDGYLVVFGWVETQVTLSRRSKYIRD